MRNLDGVHASIIVLNELESFAVATDPSYFSPSLQSRPFSFSHSWNKAARFSPVFQPVVRRISSRAVTHICWSCRPFRCCPAVVKSCTALTQAVSKRLKTAFATICFACSAAIGNTAADFESLSIRGDGLEMAWTSSKVWNICHIAAIEPLA